MLLCNLVSIAQRVGAPRIVPTRGIPYPTGDPSLSPEAEKAWRRRLLERALEALETAVHQPTVFDVAPAGRAGSDQTVHAAKGPMEKAQSEEAHA